MENVEIIARLDRIEKLLTAIVGPAPMASPAGLTYQDKIRSRELAMKFNSEARQKTGAKRNAPKKIK